MGCPAPIQPHQIQGGVGGADYPAIHQVIVWLVKKYFERRVEREQQLRSYSVFQFSKNYHLPTDPDTSFLSPTLAKIAYRHKATRLFKRKTLRKETEETRVRSCLLEFGETFAKLGGLIVDEQSVAVGGGRINVKGSALDGVADSVQGAAGGGTINSSEAVRNGGAAVGSDSAVPSGSSAPVISATKSTTAQELSKTLPGSTLSTPSPNVPGTAPSGGGKIPVGAVGGAAFDPASILEARSRLSKRETPSSAHTHQQQSTVQSSGSKSEVVAGSESAPILLDSIDVVMADLTRLDINELSGFEKQLARAAKEAKKDEILFAEKVSREESELMQQMHQIDEGTVAAISGAQIGNIVGLGADEISSAAAMYEAELQEAKKELDESLATGRLGAAATFTRQMQGLLKQQDDLSVKEKDILAKIALLEERSKVADEEKASALEYIEQLKFQFKKFSDLESASLQQKELATIKNLMALNESLKVKEADFKSQCKSKRQEFLDKIRAIDEEEDENTPEMQQQKQIEEMHTKVLAKFNRLRQLLAEVNLEVASASRQIDDTPSRTELIQYERRFVELYQQVAWKLEETRKYYDMYNTLESTLTFIQKEIKLLNSISENFAEAMRSAQSKTEFSKQFEGIVKGVEESLRRQEVTLNQKQQRLEELKQTYQNYVDEQRRYYKAVKDFQDECNKNEWLLGKLEQLKTQH
eukprot:scaffold424_cov165-Ochromonas_danica.AAC.30